MIPLLFMAAAQAAGVLPPSGDFVAAINPASIGTGDSASVNVTYYKPGDPSDYVKFYVRKSGVTTQWAFNTPGALDWFSTVAAYSSSWPGWTGAGTYSFWFEARRISSGLFDVISNIVTLTVS